MAEGSRMLVAQGIPKVAIIAALAFAPGCYSGLGGGGHDDAADDASEGGGDADGSGTAEGGTADEGGSDGDGGVAACDADTPPLAGLVRMHRANYVAALELVFGSDALASVDSTLETLPAPKIGVFASELPPPTFAEVSAYFDIASALAFELTKDATALAALEPCLADVPAGADASDACVVSFIDAIGRKVLRRPLAAEDRTRLAGDFAVGASHSVGEGIATVLVGLLLDPEFLYFVEAAGDEVAPGIVELTDHELAARLARVLWDAVPDAELSAAADAGLDDATLAAQIDRMLADPRATSAIMRFAGDWLRLETLPYPSEELLPDPAAREALHADMQAELLRFFAATTLETEGTYADLLLDRTAWVQTDELATIYGVAPGDEVTLTEQRAGLLTRAGWLASIDIRGSDAGHLIKRGNKLGRFICRELPPPDPANFPTDDPADPSTNPDAGIRERFQEATASATCSGCHVQLDAFGAPFGHYGAAGQWIDEETIVAEDGSSHRLVIDTTSTIDLDGAIAIDDAIALSEALASSDVAAHCLADQLARNALARPLQDGDGCLSQAARDALAPAEGTPQSLREAIVQLLLAPHFRQVRVP